jgi:hypothetical protein
MTTQSQGNITSAFIDLATFDELEKYMYGGIGATTYFVREVRKSTWFSIVPVVLARSSGQADFGQQWSVNISRAGDYLLHTWLRLTLPSIVVPNAANNQVSVRWTKNLMHNLIRGCDISFNDMVAQRFDNYFLDFWAAFTCPAGKRNGYDNMIGNFGEVTDPIIVGDAPKNAVVLNLPLPMFYSRDSGVALPTAALPYNEMRINFDFRNWTDLIIVQQLNDGAFLAPTTAHVSTNAANATAPSLSNSNVQVWCNYAVVSNDERQRMGAAPRDILIEQQQTAPQTTFSALQAGQAQNFDIRFSHACKAFMFGARNSTANGEMSNYTTHSPTIAVVAGAAVVNYTPAGTADPIVQTSLVYENTSRLTNMGSDYFSLVSPWYQPSAVIPTETGFHLYSYALDFLDLDPTGSTNMGKLTNVSIQPAPSSTAVAQATLPVPQVRQTYQNVLVAINNNVVRVSGGALGFPVL